MSPCSCSNKSSWKCTNNSFLLFSLLSNIVSEPTGLLVAYCSRFDVWVNSRKKIYFLSCCIGTLHLPNYHCDRWIKVYIYLYTRFRFLTWLYICSSLSFLAAYFLGMILTFVVMLLSGMGQPALLYLVPFTLVTSAVVAGCRGEIKQFWTGTTFEVRKVGKKQTVLYPMSYTFYFVCFWQLRLFICFQLLFAVFLMKFINTSVWYLNIKKTILQTKGPNKISDYS